MAVNDKSKKSCSHFITMPSLTQELNLARRACWKHDIIYKISTYITTKEKFASPAIKFDSANLENRLTIGESLHKKYDGAKSSNCMADYFYSRNCDPYCSSFVSRKADMCRQLYHFLRMYILRFFALCLSNHFSMVTSFKINLILRVLMMYIAFTSLFTTNVIRICKAVCKGNSKNKFSIKSTHSSLVSSSMASSVVFMILLSCFTVNIEKCEARPNRSVISSTIGDQNTIIESSESPERFIPPDLTVTYSDIESSQSKRAAEIPHTTSSEMSHKEVVDVGHKVERYPVAQVEFDRVKTPFIIGIWILSASVAKIGFHMTPKLHRIFPESCLLIVVGVIIGVVLYFATEVEVSPLTPNTFFLYMLPPIILDAGYFMPNRLFFDNLGTILLMAVVGTIFNIATIGASLWACGLNGLYGRDTPLLETFLFSSVISAVDPVAVLAVFEEIHVNEILYIVVFGESLLNDAVTVVLYHMMEAYNKIGVKHITVGDLASGVASFFVVALGGTVIGVIWGFLTGLVTRFTDHVRVIEPIFIFVMAYLAYLNAEIFHMSGILAITFCGITMKNYVESNISQKSHTTVKYALKMLSSSSETIIFMFLGVATVNRNHHWNTWFVVLTIVFCSVFRIIGVIILTAMANRFRLHKLSKVDQFVMSYGGLRGAVAFALVLLIDEEHVQLQPMFVTTTIAVIYFTVFLQGITIKPLVKFLNVKRASKRKPTMNERIHERFMDHLMAGIEDIVGKTGNYNVRDKFKRFDNRFIRPYLIRDLKGAEPKIIETYSKLTMRDAIEVMRRNPSTIGQMSGTESMSALFRTYTNNYISGSPSLTNLETCSRNLDMHELDYNPSKKDLTDAKIHHLLAEELKPYRRHRRLSYSRHAVDDRDLSTQVNYKMHMNIRRMVNDRKHHKRSKRGGNKPEGLKQNHVSFHDFQQNGTSKQLSHDYINEVLNETAEENPNGSTLPGQQDDWDDGLTFTAKSSLGETSAIPEEQKAISQDSDCERRVSTPTAIESQLPWKRNEDESEDGGAVKQNEFPAWASNKEYLAYNSPSATFLGGLSKPKQPKSVIGLFRRESSGSGSGSVLGVGTGDVIISDSSTATHHHPGIVGRTVDKRSASICAVAPIDASAQHAGPFPVTASHRRNTRRGSMLELSGDIIPEEHSFTKCEAENGRWSSNLVDSETICSSPNNFGHNNSNVVKLNRAPGVSKEEGNESSSGLEPLLPKSTPKVQIRRMNPVTAALLSSSNSSSNSEDELGTRGNALNSEDEDDDEEDVDIYSDDHIVNTSNFIKRRRKCDSNSSVRT